MDLVFNCPNCKQQLEADTGMAGTVISCPSCGDSLTIPAADPANIKTAVPHAGNAAAREEYHFHVPVRDTPTEVLVQNIARPLDIISKDGDKKLRIRCIRRTDCVEVGKDHFEEVVADFLGKVGEANIVTIHPLNYTHIEMGSRAILTDYGVMIIYKG